MKTLLFYTLFCFTLLCWSQAPQAFSYQAIAFDSGGNPIQNGTVSVKISILDQSSTGTSVYEETHNPTTNMQGLFNLNIGMGNVLSGTFSNISWGENSKFVKVEIDPNGGTNYTISGVNQLLSVPYALYAENSKSVENNYYNSASAFHDPLSNRIEAFHVDSGSWIGHTASDNSVLIASQGNFAFHDPLSNRVEAFNQKTGTWIGHTASSDNDTYLIGSGGGFAFHDPLSNRIEAFHIESSTWVGHTASDSSVLVGCNGSFIFHDPLSNRVEIFSQKTGTWVSHTAADNTILAGCN